jgi:hypothetical protein
MSWLFSQALVAEYSAANSLDGAPSAPSNTTPTPQVFLWRDKTTDAWKRFPSGLTCEPLTADRGEGLLTWFRAGFRAPTSVPPAREPESLASSQDCGARWRASSVKFDRGSSSWKTAHSLLSEDLPWSSVTLPRWGMMRAGELWERTTLAPLTKGSACGWSVPTPRASTGTHGIAWCRAESGQHRSQLEDFLAWQHLQGGGQRVCGFNVNPDWNDWLMGWPIGHTDLKPLATDKFQQWLRSHGVCSEGRAMSKEAA